jgi:hypothetical protein
MFTKTKMAFSAVLILGTASVALAANEHDDSVSEGQAMREMHGNPLPWWWNAPTQGRASAFAQAAEAYGYNAAQTQNLPRKKAHKH